MADVCSINECEKPARCRGWCRKHYTRWQRHGSPLTIARPSLAQGVGEVVRRETDVRRFWSKVALPDGNGCMLWLAVVGPQGYGRFRVGRGQMGAHRVSLSLAAGLPGDPELHAAHSCRNRHCVAPAHLRWATHLENEADKLVDGTILRGEEHPRVKITDTQALEIRQRYEGGGLTYKQLAAEYQVHHDTISRIVGRRVRFRQEAN